MKRYSALWCCVGGLFFAASLNAAPVPFPVAASAYQLSIDGVARFTQAHQQRLPPASLTKLMTTLLVLESGQLQQTATVSRAASRESGTRLGLRAGEQLAVQDLLAASLIYSANDACHVLAEHLAGNEKKFVRIMNQRARDWHLVNTHFANACGHDDAAQYSSAQDLAILAEKIWAYPQVREWVGKTQVTIFSQPANRQFNLLNKNALIGRYPDALGLKTGYTPKAGKCLIAVTERNGVQVLLVLLNAPNRWWDASDMLDYGFAQASH